MGDITPWGAFQEADYFMNSADRPVAFERVLETGRKYIDLAYPEDNFK